MKRSDEVGNLMSLPMAGIAISESHCTKPLTVTVATARKISGLGNTTLWALIKDRKLETVRIGRRTLVTFRSLEALLTPDSDWTPGGEQTRR
jgi:hypothetical protein